MSQSPPCDTITGTLNIAPVKKRWIFAIGLTLLSLAGPVMLLSSARWGIGLTPDSAMYIGAAQGLVDGKGYRMRVPGDRYNPVTNYMPVYPISIAAVRELGFPPLRAVKLLQAALLAINIALCGLIVFFATRSIFPSLLAAAMTLLAPDILWIHSFALSEPLFQLFVLTGGAFLAAHISQPKIWKLISAAGLIGLSYLTRYVGIAFVPAAAIALLVLSQSRWRKRLIDASLLCGICAIPVAAWMIRNHLLGSASVGRPMAWHPVTIEHLYTLRMTVKKWISPFEGMRWTCLLIAALVVAAVSLTRDMAVSAMRDARTGETPVSPKSALPLVMAIFAAVYIVFILIGISLFDYMTEMNARLMAPVLGCAIIGGCVIGASFKHPLRCIVYAIGIAIAAQWTFASVAQLSLFRKNGFGYAQPMWLRSETLSAVNQLPKDAFIYSNAWDIVALLASRPAETLPSKIIGLTGQPNPNFDRDMLRVTDDVQSKHAIIVLFRNIKSPARQNLADDEDLLARTHLATLSQSSDGIIYAAQP